MAFMFTLICSLANPRQRIADEHVDHAGAAELGVHDDHARRLLAYFADDRRFFPAFGVTQGFEGGVRLFWRYYGEELAFVGDVEGVYTQDLARPVYHVPDRKLLLPQRHAVPRVAGELVQDCAHTAACGIPHETQSRSCGFLERPGEGGQGTRVGEDF